MLDTSSKTPEDTHLRMQQLTSKTSEPAAQALGHLVGAHATITRQLSAQLVEEHGLTLSEYEVLFLLSREPDHAMRRIDLSREVRLSPSGVTRMLDRLETTGFVEKGACASDARVTYAVLTDAGMNKLRECAPAHSGAVERLIGERLSEQEIRVLGELLGRLSDLDDDCRIGD